jgi:hypothetical protein
VDCTYNHKTNLGQLKFFVYCLKITPDLIDFVVDVHAGHVLPVTLDDVDELVGRSVLSEQDLSVEDLKN